MTKEQFISEVGAVQGSLRRFLCLMCGGDSFRADDIAQEALLKAYLSFGQFSGRSSFSTWLFRIAYNCFCDARKRSALPAADAEEASGKGEGRNAEAGGLDAVDENETADKRFRYEQLYMAIGGLPVHEQEVVLLFYMEEKSIKEIEIITGMPSGTVRSHLSRARKHLKEVLSL